MDRLQGSGWKPDPLWRPRRSPDTRGNLSWANALQLFGGCFRPAWGRSRIFDAQSDSDLVRFASTASTFARQDSLNEAHRETVLAGPFADVRA